MSVALPAPLPTHLNLGCGQFPREGFLNVDHDSAAEADIHVDLSDLRAYDAFPADHFEVIVMDHVLEHLDDVFGVIGAVHRILSPGGRLEIRVPHFSRGITHPEHKHGFDVTFPEYVRPRFRGGYIGVPLELVSMRLEYMIRWDLKEVAVKPWQVSMLKPLNAIITGWRTCSPTPAAGSGAAGWAASSRSSSSSASRSAERLEAVTAATETVSTNRGVR